MNRATKGLMLAAMLGAAGGAPLPSRAKAIEPPPKPTLGDLDRIEKAKAKRRRKALAGRGGTHLPAPSKSVYDRESK